MKTKLLVLCVAMLTCLPAFAGTYPAAVEGDYVIKNFKFTTGETLPELKLHYRTIGTPTRDASGKVRNAVIVMHGTGGNGDVRHDGGVRVDSKDFPIRRPKNRNRKQSESGGLLRVYLDFHVGDLQFWLWIDPLQSV